MPVCISVVLIFCSIWPASGLARYPFARNASWGCVVLLARVPSSFLALALARHDVPPGFRFAWRIARPWLLCASVHALALRSLSPPRCLACSATVLNYWHLFQAPASQQLHLVSWKPFSALGPFVRCRLFLGPAARLFRPRLLRWSPAWFPWSLYVCIATALRNHSPLLLGLQIREMGIDHHCKKCYKMLQCYNKPVVKMQNHS